ncbi:MAG: PLP-dependent transferase, partial [Microbacterium sp.]|uniref:PLP-dependent transferase n=1 Tax=Microbacterium sp. TaxID=51671 RepID=UPI003A89395A
EWAGTRPEFETVYYPGLASHPGHDIAAAQMSSVGGMVSLALADGAAAARAYAESTRLFQLAESRGGVASLCGYPPEMTHASVRGTALAVPENIVRLSVGIESAGDLIADLEEALGRITR